MYNYYGVSTLDKLIENIYMKIDDFHYDNLYLKKLVGYLEYIKKLYGNIPTVAATILMKEFNKKEVDEVSDKIARNFERTERSRTKSKIYYLISIEYYNGYPILIVGEPDGLSFEGSMNNNVKLYEIKSFNITEFYTKFSSKFKDYLLIKKVLNMIKENSSQLILYQYLLERTQEFGLIGEIEKINSYGEIYIYSDSKEYLSWARKIIEQNLNIITKYARKYNAYNFILKDEGTININNENIYYFKIDFRVNYNQKIVETYLKNLNELIKSLKLLDNRSL
jgi:hypothetical protein